MKFGALKYCSLMVLVILLSAGVASAKIDLPESKINLQLAQVSQITMNRNAVISLAPTSQDQSYFPGRHYSKSKAIALSLLFPGAGHFYIGEKSRGEVFMGAEAAAWLGAAAFYIYGKWKEDDYHNYATVHAGIDPSGKSDDFYRTLTFYDSREEFDGRGLVDFPDRMYYPDTPEYDWQWDSETNRDAYRNIRNSSKASIRNATFMIGAAVANRILASIDTFRLLRKVNRKKKDREEDMNDDYLGFLRGVDFKFSGNPFGSNPRVHITVVKNF